MNNLCFLTTQIYVRDHHSICKISKILRGRSTVSPPTGGTLPYPPRHRCSSSLELALHNNGKNLSITVLAYILLCFLFKNMYLSQSLYKLQSWNLRWPVPYNISKLCSLNWKVLPTALHSARDCSVSGKA